MNSIHTRSVLALVPILTLLIAAFVCTSFAQAEYPNASPQGLTFSSTAYVCMGDTGTLEARGDIATKLLEGTTVSTTVKGGTAPYKRELNGEPETCITKQSGELDVSGSPKFGPLAIAENGKANFIVTDDAKGTKTVSAEAKK
jgi:hypothetical protein